MSSKKEEKEGEIAFFFVFVNYDFESIIAGVFRFIDAIGSQEESRPDKIATVKSAKSDTTSKYSTESRTPASCAARLIKRAESALITQAGIAQASDIKIAFAAKIR